MRERHEARHRRSLRLKGYDYAQAGAYFITICTQDRKCLFGKVVDGSMRLNSAGRLAATVWLSMEDRFPEIDLDMYVVMPNHLHGIIVLSEGDPPINPQGGHEGQGGHKSRPYEARAVGEIVGAFKSLVTLQFIEGVRNNRRPAFDRRVWQRNYYEHVIRDERDLARVRRYIDEYPSRWEFDNENPQRKKP